MKSALVFLVLLLNVIYVSAECEWRGTAPFCDGECRSGWTQYATGKWSNKYADGTESSPGFGDSCMTGTKAYCCRN
ncbi:hypothetical protein BD770DRAFT_343338 [Pilaira anomala]|nr:hypothetical protein BD770DRAFT_343338 [Pilaira anomala]